MKAFLSRTGIPTASKPVAEGKAELARKLNAQRQSSVQQPHARASTEIDTI
jgi:hypothetical protein